MLGRFFYISLNVAVVLAFYHEGRRKPKRFFDLQHRMLDSNYIIDDFDSKSIKLIPWILPYKLNSTSYNFEMFLKILQSLQLKNHQKLFLLSRKLEMNTANFENRITSENEILPMKVNDYKNSLHPFSDQINMDESADVRLSTTSEADDAINRTDESENWKEPLFRTSMSFTDKALLSNQDHHDYSRSRSERDISSSSMKSKSCHFQHLQMCGTTLIKKFEAGPTSASKCKIREEFLDCMVHQRERECKPSNDNFSPDGTNTIRTQVKTLLRSAHGCLLF